jgi:enoyl-[acyl-carrier protein] reductase I
MKDGGSVLTLTYLGAQRALPNYNVMGVAKAALEATVRYLAAELGERGVRVNAISAGPIRTLAASGISNFSEIFGIMEQRSPMHRSVTQDEVGKAALYLLSDLASGVTGEIHFVDTGYNIVGL